MMGRHCVISIFICLQALWFPLLETMMAAQKKVKDANDKRHVEGVWLVSFSCLMLKSLYNSQGLRPPSALIENNF